MAWAAGDTQHWWQPGIHWPVPTSRDDFGVGALEEAFLTLGYEACADELLEPGFEKLAIYGFGFFRNCSGLKYLSGQADHASPDRRRVRSGGPAALVVPLLPRRCAAAWWPPRL